MSIPTPSFPHIFSTFRNSVYEPAEDTFLLIDALEKDLKSIISQNPQIILEIGSGSGIVITALATVLKTSSVYLSTDFNEKACLATLQTAKENGVSVESIRTDLVESLMPRITGKVDLLLFNPPYVVTPSDSVGKGDITSAWAGGCNGTEVIDRLLPLVDQLLTAKGYFYLVVIIENNPDKIIETMSAYGFEGAVLLERSVRVERLNVLKFHRRSKKVASEFDTT